MAKIKLSPLVSAIRNSVGNTTFTANRYGAVARTKVAPVQPRTPRQLAVRAAFTTATEAWAGLTDSQRATWTTFAAAHPISDVFGDSRVLAGNAAYVAVNAQRAVVGLAAVTTPPPTGGLSPAAPSAAAQVGSTSVITVTTAAQAVSTGFYVVSTTPGLSPGRSFAGSASRIGGVVATVDAATTAIVTPVTYNPLLSSAADMVALVKVAQVDINGFVVATTAYKVVAS